MTPRPPVPLESIRHFLLDLDGTIYLGGRILPGAVAFIEYLRASGRSWLFFTNNPSADARQYSEKLQGLGIDAAPADILTSGEATARYLAQETAYRRVFALGTPSFEAELAAAGITPVQDDAEAVVLAFDKTLTYDKIMRAATYLDAGLPYIATNPDKVCPTETGYIPDCGAMAAMFEAATGRTPKYIGKPNAEMIRMGLAKLGADPAATAMVGDRLYTDMQMAYNAGITSVLVLSGETKSGALQQAPRVPDYVFGGADGLRDALAGADGGG